jgi:HAD superfamily hydrolase (TIGR01509 family)
MYFEAVIFDMDGVLVDSEPAHREASRQLVAPHVLSDEEYARYVGSTGGVFMAFLRERYGLTASDAELDARYHTLVMAELHERGLPALDGARELLDALREQGTRLALASASQPAWVERTLAGAGLEGCFEVIVAGDAVARGKPAPDIYLHAAERLKVAPAACMAVEDSVYGVTSAHAAGMAVVQSRQASIAPPPQPGARVVIDSLRAFEVGWLERGLPG